MNQHPQSPDSSTPGSDDSEPMSLEEFEQWAKENPDEAASALRDMVEASRQIFDSKDEDVTPEMRSAAAEFLAKVEFQEKLLASKSKFQELVALMKRPGGSMRAEDRMAGCNRLVDELTDSMLDLPEPHRTQFLNQFIPLRDQVRALRVPKD